MFPGPAATSPGVSGRFGSRELSHVGAPGAGGAYTLKVPRFQNAQKFCLQIQRNGGNFIQKKCAAIRQFETPDAVSARIRKSSFYVPEELAFENALRQAARIYSHHWPRRADSARVVGTRDEANGDCKCGRDSA